MAGKYKAYPKEQGSSGQVWALMLLYKLVSWPGTVPQNASRRQTTSEMTMAPVQQAVQASRLRPVPCPPGSRGRGLYGFLDTGELAASQERNTVLGNSAVFY